MGRRFLDCCKSLFPFLITIALTPNLVSADRPEVFELNASPADFNAIEEQIGDPTSHNGKIFEYLQNSMCGGWDMNDSVGEGLGGKVAKVLGAPGHEGEPLGDKLSGMAKRDQTFIYPPNARGLSTLCGPDTAQASKWIWDEADHTWISKSCIHPYFEDLACTWRLKDNASPPLDACMTGLSVSFEKKKSLQSPIDDVCSIIPETGEDPPAEPRVLREDPQSVNNCVEFCRWLNAWKFTNCISTQPVYDFTTFPPTYLYDTCVAVADFYFCNDLMVPCSARPFGEPSPPPCSRETCTPGVSPVPSKIEFPNATGCLGDQCRCSWGPPANDPVGPYCGLVAPTGQSYKSFFRWYTINYSRTPVSAVPSDVYKKGGFAGCYGFYNEFDPGPVDPLSIPDPTDIPIIHRRTEYYDQRCTFDFFVTDLRGTKATRSTQRGKGEFGEQTDVPDLDPADSVNQRQHIGGAFDSQKDPWYLGLGGGFGFFNTVLLNLTKALFAPDGAVITGMEQIPWVDGGLALSNTIRDFDDTAFLRSIVRWWHKQETIANVLFSPPLIRVIFPPLWAVGIDANDPLFRRQKHTAEPAKALLNLREEPIDIQIPAKEDTLGSIFAFLEHSSLRIREDPIPVIVPLASPTELRSLAQQWCSWYMRKYLLDSCNGAPSDLQGLMTRLREYADYIDGVRVLRAHLALYAGRMLAVQKDLIIPILSWMRQNLQIYKNYYEQREQVFALRAMWQATQENMVRFHKQTNAPWCMNQRFTLPVYSLLDQWLLSRLFQADAHEKCISMAGGCGDLPTLEDLGINPSEELVLDLSAFNTLSEYMRMPVLKPIQIRLDLSAYTPPSLVENYAFSLPPSLPSLNTILLSFDPGNVFDLPGICSPSVDPYPPECPPVKLPPLIHTPPLPGAGLNPAFKFAQIYNKLLEMESAYYRFWISLNLLDPTTQPRAYAEFERLKENLECQDFAKCPCVHVEMDLLERITRIGSRPAVQLKEDYDSRGAPRSFAGSCPPEDHVCLLLQAQERDFRTGWQLIAPPLEERTYDKLRSLIRYLILPEPIGGVSSSSMPPYAVSPKEFLPALEVLPEPRIRAVSSSSASSIGP